MAAVYLSGEKLFDFEYEPGEQELTTEEIAAWLLTDEAPMCPCIREGVSRFVVRRDCKHIFVITARYNEQNEPMPMQLYTTHPPEKN